MARRGFSAGSFISGHCTARRYPVSVALRCLTLLTSAHRIEVSGNYSGLPDDDAVCLQITFHFVYAERAKVKDARG